MPIVINDADVDARFTAREILDQDPRVLRALAKAALLRQAELVVRVLEDDPHVTPVTRDSINEALVPVEAHARDILQDLFDEMCIEVERVMNTIQFGAAVTGMRFDLAGDVTEIELNVSLADRD